MATFYSLLSFMAVNSFEYSDPGSFNIISSLPLEIAITLLRMLPGKDLLNAASVNKNWLRICQSDRKLRQKIRRYIRQHNRVLISRRLLASSGRNMRSYFTNRPEMTNLVNIANMTNHHVHRIVSETTPSRYMPYHREQSLGLTIGSSSRRRRSRNTGVSTVAWPRLRM